MIGLLTYQKPHRKTQDLLFRLLISGYDVVIIASPWEERKNFKPLFPHRPFSRVDITPLCLAKLFGVEYIEIENYGELASIDVNYFLIGGAGIINPLPCVPVINSHPGYLPCARGLDALKWSIYHEVTKGVTVHRITENVDDGPILFRREIDPEPGEQFYHYAMRIYEAEITALVEHFGNQGITNCDLIYEDTIGRINKRMPHNIELEMMKKFVS